MITGVVLARNEETNVVDCLKSLRPHVGELILIDMVSTDRTVELARPLVDQVLTHPLVPRFDAARNVAFDAARHDWLWFLDADERVPTWTGELVRQTLQEHGQDLAALSIPFKSHFCGKWIQHSGWWPGYTMPRVLKRGRCRFSERLHGGVHVDGPEGRLPPDPNLAIDHFSYRSLEHYVEKFNRYTSVEAAQMLEDGVAADWRKGVEAMVQDLWAYYEHRQGVQDGVEGWLLAWMAGQYRWLTHAKLAEARRGDRAMSIPASLDEVVEQINDSLMAARSRRPPVPLGILWKAPLWDPSGYAEDSRTLLKALAGWTREDPHAECEAYDPRPDREVAVEEIRWSDRTCSLAAADERLLRLLTRGRLPKGIVAVTSCVPTLVRPDRRAAFNVLRTTFETDRIPPEWMSHLEGFDEVWTFSRHDRRAFIRRGVAPERIRIVPGCVDESIFTPEGPVRPLPEALAGRFVFLSVFDWQRRKGWDALLRAYVEEFALSDRTALFLKITRSHGQPMEWVRQEIDHVLASLGTDLRTRVDIVVCDDLLSVEQVAALYRSCPVFVLPTRGEGFGRPFLEAMACGRAVVGTVGSGNGEGF